MDALGVPTMELVLERLGFSTFPAPGIRGLNALYRAWCRKVPFDNVIKRIDLVEGYTPFRNTEPENFFPLWLVHGTGGTCWPSSHALGALLESLGFDVRLGSASMADDVMGRQHTHATLIVTIDGQQFWVDTSMLTDDPVPLAPGSATELHHPVRPVRAEPVDDLWRVHWQSGAQENTMGCLLLDDDVDASHYSVRYEASREWSPFNTGVFATQNTNSEVLTMANGQFIRLDADGRSVEAPLGSDRRRELLVETFAFSEQIIDVLPPDEPPPATDRAPGM